MTNDRKRHWFSFSLRTMFVVVTVFGVWLGYEILWIQQRHELTDRHGAMVRAEAAYGLGKVELYDPAPHEIPTAVRVLSLFGEKPWQAVILIFFDDGSGKLTTEDKRELESARMLFPESMIMWNLAKPK